MKKKYLLICLFNCIQLFLGQITISSTNPSQGTYTDCANSNTTCSGTPFYGGTIRMRVLSISNNTVTFSIASCNGSNFTTSGTAYIYRDSYCNATLLNSGAYTSGSSQKSLTYTFNSAGTFYIYGVTQTSGGAYYYTQPISVSVTAPAPSTPTLSSPATNSCVNYSNPPTLYWNSAANASGYFIYVNDITNGANNPINLLGSSGYSSGTSYTIPSGLTNWLPNRQYAWYVVSTNSSGNSSPSSIWIFNTGPTNAQATNTTSAPTNGTVYVGGTVNLYTNNTDSGVSYSWTGPNGFTSSLRNPVLSNVQSNMSGTYYVTVTNSYGCSYSSSTYVSISQAPSLTVVYPNGGENFMQGQSVNIQWGYTGLTGNIQVEITDANNNPLSSPFNPIGISGSGVAVSNGTLNWTIPASLPNGQYKIKIYNLPLPATVVDYSNATFTVSGASTSCITWTDGAPDSTYLPASDNSAFQYLCNNQIITSNQLRADIDNPIKREELAKVAFKGLYKPNGSASTPADNYPVPFIDLQPISATYIREAKVLSYLEYGDGISAFNRDFTHFKPKDYIKRQHALKLLMETFNIAPASVGSSNSWGSGVFIDVNGTTNFEMYYYLVKAYQLGFIKAETQFRPNDNVSRRELFVWLYKMLNNLTYNIPTSSDFFAPANITPSNYGRALDLNDGNFNSYTKTSFGFQGKVPLSFTHIYNSSYTELPNNYYGLEPLGKGWTHNYNVYIREVTNGTSTDDRSIIYWGDGTMNSYFNNNGIFTPETVGTYATLVKSGTTYTYKTKSQIQYIFTQTGNYYTLSQVKDRNGNTTSLSWSLVGTVPHLVSASDPTGRSINFTYQSGTDLLSKVSESGLNRSISFTYINNNSDLATYTDTKGNVTTYIYDDYNNPLVQHLLKQIKLPKGNIVNSTYANRKLTSTNFANAYQATVATVQNYSAQDPVNQAKVSISRNGQTLTTNSTLNKLGNIITSVSPTSNISVSYADTSNSTKPTLISNSVNGLSGGMSYDSNGNVTQISKVNGSSSITEYFTYNTTNDLLSHTNARGNNTKFEYDANGNLTKTTDALNNITTIAVNSDGTVSKVTNPEGIYTDFEYNSYGNTTKTKLMGSLVNEVQYDGASRAIKTIDPNGIISQITYDNNDKVLKTVADASGLANMVSYDYDTNDNLKTITNPKGDATNLTYNDQDQMTEYSFAGYKKTYSFNDDGTINTFKDQNNVAFTNIFDAEGKLSNDGYAQYTYNADKTINTVNRGNKTIAYSYDALKRITKVSYGDTGNNIIDNVQYQYDNNNNVISITYPDGFKVGYEYDAVDRLTKVYNFSTNANYAQYTYLADGRLSQQTNGNGTKTIYSYDSYGRVNKISNQKSTGSIIYEQSYTMDNVGNHLSESDINNTGLSLQMPVSATTSYSHDTANRMNTQGSNSFTYDGNGNNLSISGTTSSTYTYDPKDNLLTSTNPARNFDYDPLENRRISGTSKFALDILGGSNVLVEDNSGTKVYYIHGLGLICRIDTSSNASYYHYDYRGSTVAITNASQNITHAYKYGPFGENFGATENGFANRFRYVGKYGVQYEANHLYFMRARYYNPMQGRFLGEDPVWNTNLFVYCGNNPIIKIDRTGNEEQKVVFVQVQNFSAGINPVAYISTTEEINKKQERINEINAKFNYYRQNGASEEIINNYKKTLNTLNTQKRLLQRRLKKEVDDYIEYTLNTNYSNNKIDKKTTESEVNANNYFDQTFSGLKSYIDLACDNISKEWQKTKDWTIQKIRNLGYAYTNSVIGSDPYNSQK